MDHIFSPTPLRSQNLGDQSPVFCRYLFRSPQGLTSRIVIDVNTAFTLSSKQELHFFNRSLQDRSEDQRDCHTVPPFVGRKRYWKLAGFGHRKETSFWGCLWRKFSTMNPIFEKTKLVRVYLNVNESLGGSFKYVLFSPLFGEDFQFDEYFSKGLKPPTRCALFHLSVSLQEMVRKKHTKPRR